MVQPAGAVPGLRVTGHQAQGQDRDHACRGRGSSEAAPEVPLHEGPPIGPCYCGLRVVWLLADEPQGVDARLPEPRPGPIGPCQAVVGLMRSWGTPSEARASRWAVRSWSSVDTRA